VSQSEVPVDGPDEKSRQKDSLSNLSGKLSFSLIVAVGKAFSLLSKVGSS
jgi:hypothetical protein